MKILYSILALMLLIGASLGATTPITQYNQTWATNVNSAAAPWTSLAAWNSIYSMPGGNQALIVNTTVTTATSTVPWGINLTLKAGSYWGSVTGDKLYTLSRNRTYVIGPFDTSRFKQRNGTIVLSTNASRGKAICIALPKG